MFCQTKVLMLLPNILNEKGLFGRMGLLQLDSLAALTSELSRLLDQADKHAHASSADAHTSPQLALDRLAQALQVAKANGALLCSRGTILSILFMPSWSSFVQCYFFIFFNLAFILERYGSFTKSWFCFFYFSIF